jgi:hypothetical protein
VGVAIYIGYYRMHPDAAAEMAERERGGQPGLSPRVRELVRELPDRLTSTCRIVAAYSPMAGAVLSDVPPPGVTIVETDNIGDLQFISAYYAGFAIYHWVPAMRVGTDTAEREAWATAQLSPRPGPARASG